MDNEHVYTCSKITFSYRYTRGKRITITVQSRLVRSIDKVRDRNEEYNLRKRGCVVAFGVSLSRLWHTGSRTSGQRTCLNSASYEREGYRLVERESPMSFYQSEAFPFP